ncbi:hypothetical protein M1N56_07980 [Dehalococcoidia bacterium]|nr:hypothetical protein [Dehalococcoidia bacterium]
MKSLRDLGRWLGRQTRTGRTIQDARGIDPDTGEPYPEGVNRGSYLDRIRPPGFTDWAGPSAGESRTGYIPLRSSDAIAGSIAIQESSAMQWILESAPESEVDAMSLDDFVVSIENLRRTTASKVLPQLVDEERLLFNGTGKEGSPFRYWRA